MRPPAIVQLCGAAAALILMLSSGEARADVVGRPPPDCPAGSSPDVCHGGPFCRLLTCVNDDECNDGQTCQDAKTCVGGIQCGGLEGGGDPPIATHEGSCEQSGCSGVECQTVKQCLPSGDPTSGGGSSGGGSATGTSGGGSATGGASSSGPTSSATGGSGSGDSAGSGDSTGGDGTKGCACNHAGESGGLVSLVALGLLALGRRRARR